MCIKAFSKAVGADTTPPTTTARGVPDGWSKTAATVSFSADDGAGVGVQATLARVDAGTYQQCSPSMVSADGTHTVQYYSVDKVGNAETPKSATVRVDSTKPSTAATNLQASATTGWVSASGLNVVLTPSDATSGIARLDYTIDATPYAHVGATVATATVSGAGSHAMTYRATDVAGNLETTKTGYVNLDRRRRARTRDPRCGRRSTRPAVHGSGPVMLTITGTDNAGGSGVATKQYRLQGATAWTTYTRPVAFPEGTSTFESRGATAPGIPGTERPSPRRSTR